MSYKLIYIFICNILAYFCKMKDKAETNENDYL